MGVLANIFGSGSVIEKGMELIDDAYTSPEEKSNAKGKLLNAYAPFKLAQRYLVLVFSFNFTLAFVMCLVLVGFNKDPQPVIDVVVAFNLGYIILTIVGFYFFGGAAEGFAGKIKRPGK